MRGRPKRQPDERFHSRIQYWRKKKLLTIAEVANRAKLSPETVSDIERGIRFPYYKTLQSIANALGVTVDDLAEMEDKQIA